MSDDETHEIIRMHFQRMPSNPFILIHDVSRSCCFYISMSWNHPFLHLFLLEINYLRIYLRFFFTIFFLHLFLLIIRYLKSFIKPFLSYMLSYKKKILSYILPVLCQSDAMMRHSLPLYDAHPHGTAGILLYYRNRISCYILRNRSFFDDSSKYNVISDTYSATIKAPPQVFSVRM